uniref:Uncharacterized protein n=1 Tax=Solanum lycopersicum TaxID=4081 RepID=A0A3Q7IFS5_SOLLC
MDSIHGFSIAPEINLKPLKVKLGFCYRVDLACSWRNRCGILYLRINSFGESFSQAQTSEDNNSIYIDVELNYEPVARQKLASFLGIISRTTDLTQLNVNDWRVFDDEEKKKLVEFVKDFTTKKIKLCTNGRSN